MLREQMGPLVPPDNQEDSLACDIPRVGARRDLRCAVASRFPPPWIDANFARRSAAEALQETVLLSIGRSRAARLIATGGLFSRSEMASP